jgi:hypothetical protein
MKAFLLIIALLFLGCQNMWAQGCTMCAETAAHLGESGAKGLNFGILYLAAIPVTFMGTVAYLWYKKSKK